MVITHNGHFAFTSDADSLTVSGYPGEDGSITLLNANRTTDTTPAPTFAIEECVSRNRRHMYVLDTRAFCCPREPDRPHSAASASKITAC
jgi:hypothetical protein